MGTAGTPEERQALIRREAKIDGIELDDESVRLFADAYISDRSLWSLVLMVEERARRQGVTLDAAFVAEWIPQLTAAPEDFEN